MHIRIAFVSMILLLSLAVAFADQPPQPVTINYGTISLTPTGPVTWEPGLWDLNLGPVNISYTLDLSGAPNVDYDWNWNNMGLVGLRHPAPPYNGARMGGGLMDWDNRFTQFPVYPDNNASLDMDDKFNLQRFPNPGSWDETMYDVECDTNTVTAPVGSGSNYGIWYDRDGVDQWQAAMWGMVNGGTYNTQGVYPLRLLFRKASSAKGTACPIFFPALANPFDSSGYGIRTGFYTSWVPSGPQDRNIGLSFDADEAKMAKMQVLVEGNPAVGAIVIANLTVSGYMNADSGKDSCKKDGWKLFTNPLFKNQGQCVSYFVSNRP